MTKYVLISAFPYGMKIGISSEVFETEGALREYLLNSHDMDEDYIESLINEGEVVVDYTEEPISYKIQVVA